VDWQERAVGGLGWFLVRQMVDDIQYESSADAEGAFNRLTLVKRIAAPPHPPVPLT
jgi:anti-sigma regulatory factor (Ser/Thr protein kinase)